MLSAREIIDRLKSGRTSVRPTSTTKIIEKVKLKKKSKIEDELEEEVNIDDQDVPTKASDLTKALVLSDTGLNDDNKFALQNFGTTNFPRNTPCYINGPKGSGKTYLLASLLQYIFKNNLCRRMFYIYAENVDTTVSRAVPKDKIYQVPKSIAEGLLIKYLSKKTRLCSCSRFVRSFIHFGKDTLGGLELDELLSSNVYWDNFLDELSKRKNIKTSNEMYNFAIKTVKKYSNPTIIKIGTIDYNVGDITDNDFDIFVIDDIAQFYDLFGNTRFKSPLYKYFTITRQNMTSFYLAGQELGQLQKSFRDQLGALVIMYGSYVDDLTKYRMGKKLREEIEEKFKTMSNHEGILYNYNDRMLEVIKSEK